MCVCLILFDALKNIPAKSSAIEDSSETKAVKFMGKKISTFKVTRSILRSSCFAGPRRLEAL